MNTCKKNDRKNKKWVLNTNLNKLTVNERRNALVLLYFLNEYKEQDIAFRKLKSIWVDKIYKLPKTSAKGYNSTKNGRYNLFSRLKRIYQDYMVEL